MFLHYHIAVIEDANKNIWVVMLDWNMDWVACHDDALGITPELAKGAIDIRNKMK